MNAKNMIKALNTYSNNASDIERMIVYAFIKKENIGLIEVMGLAVLPSRLAKEMAFMEDALLKGEKEASNPALASHYPWICEILEKHENITKENVKTILQEVILVVDIPVVALVEQEVVRIVAEVLVVDTVNIAAIIFHPAI